MSNAAPDFKTLYEYENNLEQGFASVIVNLADNIYTQRQNISKLAPRAELKVTMGASSGHRGPDKSSVLRYDIFAFALQITFVTVRSDNFAAHNVMLGKVRSQLGDVKNNVNGALNINFPYYQICMLRDQGTEPGFHADDDFDQSAVNYTGVMAILPDAWPNS